MNTITAIAGALDSGYYSSNILLVLQVTKINSTLQYTKKKTVEVRPAEVRPAFSTLLISRNQFNTCCSPMGKLSDVKLIRTDTLILVFSVTGSLNT